MKNMIGRQDRPVWAFMYRCREILSASEYIGRGSVGTSLIGAVERSAALLRPLDSGMNIRSPYDYQGVRGMMRAFKYRLEEDT